MPKTIDPPGEFDYHVEKIETTTASDSRVVFIDGRIVIAGSFVSRPEFPGRDMVPILLPCGIRVDARATKWSPMMKTDWVATGPPVQKNDVPLGPTEFKELMRLVRVGELRQLIDHAEAELAALTKGES